MQLVWSLVMIWGSLTVPEKMELYIYIYSNKKSALYGIVWQEMLNTTHISSRSSWYL